MTAGDNMSENTQTEIVIGLSNEEKDDLEKMIKTFREDQSAGPSISSIEDVQKQIGSISENPQCQILPYNEYMFRVKVTKQQVFEYNGLE